MLVFAMLAALATAAGATSVGVSDGGVAAVKGAKKDANDPNRRVCKAQTNAGSHLASSVCMTQQQWDRNEETSRQFLRDTQARAGLGDKGPPQGYRAP